MIFGGNIQMSFTTTAFRHTVVRFSFLASSSSVCIAVKDCSSQV